MPSPRGSRDRARCPRGCRGWLRKLPRWQRSERRHKMAQPGRNMGIDFRQGTVDNTYIQYAPNRGGLVEMDWPVARAESWAWPQYINVGVRGPDPCERTRRHIMDSRIIEPYTRQPPQRRWPI